VHVLGDRAQPAGGWLRLTEHGPETRLVPFLLEEEGDVGRLLGRREEEHLGQDGRSF
jgi:hypothetical protein